jgi:hypothetical protein
MSDARPSKDNFQVIMSRSPETGAVDVSVVVTSDLIARYGPHDIVDRVHSLIAERLADEIMKERGEVLRSALEPARIVEETLKVLAVRLVGNASSAIMNAMTEIAERTSK